MGLTLGDGFAPGGLGGGTSGVVALVGSGSGGAFRLLFVLSLAFALAWGLNSATGEGNTAALALAFALALTFEFAGSVIVPPAGIPTSPFPVGGCDGWTG